MTNNNVQKMIDDPVEEFRKKPENEFNELELTGTLFECINNNELFIAKADELEVGTLILVEGCEFFRILETSDQKPWITYMGEAYTHAQFADLMRERSVKPKIIHMGS